MRREHARIGGSDKERRRVDGGCVVKHVRNPRVKHPGGSSHMLQGGGGGWGVRRVAIDGHPARNEYNQLPRERRPRAAAQQLQARVQHPPRPRFCAAALILHAANHVVSVIDSPFFMVSLESR